LEVFTVDRPFINNHEDIIEHFSRCYFRRIRVELSV